MKLSKSHAVLFVALLSVVAWCERPCAADAASDWRRHVPQTTQQLNSEQVAGLQKAADDLEDWAAELAASVAEQQPAVVLRDLQQLLAAYASVNHALNKVLELRTEFVNSPPDDPQRAKTRYFLQTASSLIDLSGRLRYVLRDAVDAAALALDPYPPSFDRLIELLTEHRCSVGAAVMSYVLFDPPDGSELVPFPPETRAKVLRLISAARTADLLPTLAAYVRTERNPQLVVSGVDVIRYLGIPQKPRLGGDPTLPEPPILAEELLTILERINRSQLVPALAGRRQELIGWMNHRIQHGVTADSYRVGDFEVREGDWLLMRNPSPYNLFTDLSPGLFTHVGVVGAEVGDDGIRRLVIVDLPERGAHIPATTLDTYVDRTLHYFFVRHDDPNIGRQMGQAAIDMIGNEALFDLKFDTRRVDEYASESLRDKRIHTYCAGFLLLCAGQTAAARKEFFPISEAPAGGHTLTNLEKLGLSIGDNFYSPTGPLFSPHMKIVGRREPMYHPGREIKEAVYDHFAHRMRTAVLTPSPDAYQTLREKIAAMAKHNSLLARVLAQANNVSEHMDLESAAKAAAVIETLDEIAESSEDNFYEAVEAIATAASPQPATGDRQQQEKIESYRRTHAELIERFSEGRLSPRQLRIELVESYAQLGKQKLDERFFTAE